MQDKSTGQPPESTAKEVWIGLAIALALLAIGLWVFESLRCDPLESDLALVKKTSCSR